MSWSAKSFEEKMTPFIDDLYKGVFGSRLKSVFRSDRGGNSDARTLFMDKELAIDTHITFNDGSVLTFQEKTRRNRYLRFNDFTFEYYNDPKTKDEGEWFKLASQLYFFGYANKNETGYAKYWILNVARLRTGLMRDVGIKVLERKYLKQNPPPAKANFFTIPFSLIESMEGVVLYKHEE